MEPSQNDIRLQKLGELVGKYYFEYMFNSSVKRVLRNLLGSGNTRLAHSEATIYLHASIAQRALIEAIRAINQAEKDRTVYREFTNEVGKDVYGSLDVARTITLLPKGMYASMTYKPSLKSPEFSALKYIGQQILNKTERIQVNWEEDHLIKNFFRSNRHVPSIPALRRGLDELLQNIPDTPFTFDDTSLQNFLDANRDLLPNWLLRAYYAYRLTSLVEKTPHVSREKQKGDELVLLGWKLYEIYVSIMVVEELLNSGYTLVSRREGDLAFEKKGKTLRILFNSALSWSSIISYDEVQDQKLIANIRGKPDISFTNNDYSSTILFECKFSTQPSYITLGRFKVLAYMLEYFGSKGVLVFPKIGEDELEYDDEDAGTRDLYNRMKDGIVEVIINLDKDHNANMFLLSLDPLMATTQTGEAELKKRIQTLLEKLGIK